MLKVKVVDLGLQNTTLYKGCTVEEVGGRLNLITPLAEAVAIVGRNANTLQYDPESV